MMAIGQQGIADIGAIADNMKKFAELYGIATRMMNLGGTILNSASGGNGGSPSSLSSSSSSSSLNERNYFKDDNRLQSDLENSIPATSLFGFGRMPSTQKPAASLFGDFGGLGGGLGGTQSAQKTGLESLMNMFLGTGVTEPPSQRAPSLTSFFSPSNDFTGGGGDFNMDKMINALVSGGAKPAPRADPNGMQALLGGLFGRKRK